MYYASDEWRKLFDSFAFFCFKIAGFEIVRTESMGLGLIIFILTSAFVLRSLYLSFAQVLKQREESLCRYFLPRLQGS